VLSWYSLFFSCKNSFLNIFPEIRIYVLSKYTFLPFIKPNFIKLPYLHLNGNQQKKEIAQ